MPKNLCVTKSKEKCGEDGGGKRACGEPSVGRHVQEHHGKHMGMEESCAVMARLMPPWNTEQRSVHACH